MKQSRKMVLISEDEYAQLKAMTKPTEDVTESDKGTQTETSMPHFPIRSQCDSKKSTKIMQVEKKITKTNPPRKKRTKIGSTKHELTQSGLGVKKLYLKDPLGYPLRNNRINSVMAYL